MIVLAVLNRTEIYRLYARTALLSAVVVAVAAITSLGIGEENTTFDYLIWPVVIFGSFYSAKLMRAAWIVSRRGAPLAFLEGNFLWVLNSHFEKYEAAGLKLRAEAGRDEFKLINAEGRAIASIKSTQSRNTFEEIIAAFSHRMIPIEAS